MQAGVPVFGKILLWLLMLSLAGCSSWPSRGGDPGTNGRGLSVAEFARVEAAVRALPGPLHAALDHRELYRVVTEPLPSAVGPYPLIRLNPESLGTGAVTDEALRRAILLQFFGQRVDRLDLFCQGRTTCRELEVKQLQLERFFSRRYSARSGAESLGERYARQASEYFVDDQYRCKYPLVARVLESVWDHEFAAPPCSPLVPFLVSEGEGANEVRWVDPARVYAVHLLFAGSSGSTMSRFGHVTLRIVQCAKERTAVDQHCEEDLFDHLSLGFKANIDELDLSLWKGIKGGYAMKLYAKSFMDTYREYSIDEFRDLYSLPLGVAESDKRLLIQALSEIHWSYTADYRFFTRNCATEVQWLLETVAEAGQPSAQVFFPKTRYRPDKLFGDARGSTRFQAETLVSLSDAERQGYYFPSAEPYYQVAVDSIASALAASPSASASARTPEAWLARRARARGEYWLKPALERSDRKAYTGHAALVLEGWVARKLRRQILADLTLYYAGVFQALIADEHVLQGSEKRLLLACVNAIKVADTAGTSAQGIPQAPRDVAPSVCDVKDEQLATLLRRLFETFPVGAEQRRNIDELSDTLDNIKAVRVALAS